MANSVTTSVRCSDPFDSPAGLAQQRLRESPYGPVRQVNCRYEDGQLTLSGIVPTFYMKQQAQATIGDLPGVNTVDNQIEVAN